MTLPGEPPRSAEQSRLTTISLVILVAVAIAAALAYTGVVMIPFVLAIFFTYLIAPLVDVLQNRHRFPRVAGIAVALVVALAVLSLIAFLITTSTRGVLESVDLYQARLLGAAQRMFDLLQRYGLDVGEQPVLNAIDRVPFLDIAQQAFGTAFDIVTIGGLVLIFVIYRGRAGGSPDTYGCHLSPVTCHLTT